MAAVLEEVARWDREGALEVYLDEVAAKRMNGWWWNEREIFGRWAQDDPEGAVAAGLRVQEETGRDGPLKLTVEAWAKFEGAAAGDWVKREVEAGRLDGIAYGYLMSGWAEVDMQAAGDFGLERFGKKGFGNAMLHVMNAWAHCDFGEAASWVDGIADEEVRGRMQALLVSQSGNTANREPALEFALKHVGKNEGMLRAVTGHGCELATRSGAEVALAWGEEHLEDAGQLAEYRQGVLDHLSWEDPAAAAKQVAEMFGDEEQLALQEKIAKRWAEGDAEGARTWAESLPEGEEREVALLGLAEGWMADNGRREDAAKWAESFPEGEFRDQLTDRHARSLMNVKSIEKALGAASQIADPAQRELTFEAITKVWYRDEIKAEAAREFIEGTEMMSEGAKWRVLNRKWGYPD